MINTVSHINSAYRLKDTFLGDKQCLSPCNQVIYTVSRGGSRICGKGGGAQRRSCLKTLFGISSGGAQGACALFGPPWRPSLEFQKGGARPLRPPPLNPLVVSVEKQCFSADKQCLSRDKHCFSIKTLQSLDCQGLTRETLFISDKHCSSTQSLISSDEQGFTRTYPLGLP